MWSPSGHLPVTMWSQGGHSPTGHRAPSGHPLVTVRPMTGHRRTRHVPSSYPHARHIAPTTDPSVLTLRESPGTRRGPLLYRPLLSHGPLLGQRPLLRHVEPPQAVRHVADRGAHAVEPEERLHLLLAGRQAGSLVGRPAGDSKRRSSSPRAGARVPASSGCRSIAYSSRR
jgi:hypothetical protein